MLDRAESTITRQLDLAKFLKKQRMFLISIMATLSMPQLLMVQRLSENLINETAPGCDTQFDCEKKSK